MLCTELGLQFQKQRFMISLSLQACYKNNARLKYSVAHIITVIAIESAVKYSFVLKGMQTRRKGQNNAELTLSPRSCVKSLITAKTAIPYNPLYSRIFIDNNSDSQVNTLCFLQMKVN